MLKLIRAFVWGVFFVGTSQSFSQSLSIPLNTVKKPAADLLDQSGRKIEVGEAAALAEQGFDLSLLNPEENKFWQNRPYPAVDVSRQQYPTPQVGVQFLSDEAKLLGTYMARVQSRQNPQVFFRLSLSRFSQSTLMRAALLRKLGYYVPSPQVYKNLRLFFKDEKEKEKFLESAQLPPVLNDFESRKWIIENNTQNHSVVMSDALLEPATSEYFDIQWGLAPNPQNPSQLPIVQRLSRYRAYRALILPYTLIDVPESVNRYSPKAGSILSAHLVLTHPSAESFSASTYEDVRWAIRKTINWTAADFREIVAAGQYPADIQEVVYRKLLYRWTNLLELTQLQSLQTLVLPSLEYSSSSGSVKKGKIMQEFFDGYPQRFAHGDRESPFKDGDILRYLGIHARSTGISTLLSEFNKKLQVLAMEDILQGRVKDIQEKIINHIRKRPLEPLYQKVEAWGGPLAGANVYATRHVSTGTYNESSAAIQLVDNLSVSASLGYFVGIDGVPKMRPGVGGNINIMRDYTHVRPILSIEEGTKVDWKNLVIPLFMKNLGDILSGKRTINPDKPDEPMKQPLDAFMSELRDGEVFTITDSVVGSAYAQIGSSFDVLMGINPLSVANSIALGADASRIILRQTSIQRTSQGIQVYVRDQKGTQFGITFDVNYFINIFRLRADRQKMDLKTDAFIIDYDPSLADLIDTEADKPFVKDFLQTRENLKPALLALFDQNDTEELYSKFDHKRFDLKHELKTSQKRIKFLMFRANSFNEDHLLKIRYPKNPDFPELNPADEEVILFSNKKGQLFGKDIFQFGLEFLESFIKDKAEFTVDLNGDQNPNPANNPFGSAYWRTITTERDLSTGAGEKYPDVSVIQHVWGGWSIKQKKFFDLIDEITEKFKNSGLGSFRLIEKEAFVHTQKIDFYRITASLSVLPGGLSRLRDLMLQPEMDGQKAQSHQFLSGLFQRISEGTSGHSARANDPQMLKDFIQILGNGDFNKGLKIYQSQCRAQQRQQNPISPSYSGAWVGGNYYECLTPWAERLIKLAGKYPVNDTKAQVRWMSEVLYVLDEYIPLPQVLRYLEPANYVFLIRVNGFRTGDEDGDIEYFSNTLGDPPKNIDYANGLFNMFATKTRISPVELDRSLGAFR